MTTNTRLEQLIWSWMILLPVFVQHHGQYSEYAFTAVHHYSVMSAVWGLDGTLWLMQYTTVSRKLPPLLSWHLHDILAAYRTHLNELLPQNACHKSSGHKHEALYEWAHVPAHLPDTKTHSACNHTTKSTSTAVKTPHRSTGCKYHRSQY